jgi:hypothetical protein
VSWPFLFAVGLVWIAVAVAVGALVGHGIAFGNGSLEAHGDTELQKVSGGRAEASRPFADDERISA